MTNPSDYRPAAGEIPTKPGVYRFSDPSGRVIYVGKARNLRQRLANYFAPLPTLHPRTARMVTTASRVVWTVVGTEVEALSLEYSWIKEFDPRFNVKYRDDKSYPYLAVTMGEKIPRVSVMRGSKRTGTRYFGPYSHAWAIRETVDLLLRVFPIRSCTSGVFRAAAASGRPCLLGYIEKCTAPCVGRISPEDHRDLAEDFCRFMAGDTGTFVRRLEAEMARAAGEMDYERAARLRDDLGALRRVVEKNAVVLDDGTDADIFALAQDDLEVSVQVFHVRGGRVRGQRGWVSERVEDLDDGALVERLLQQVYAEKGADVPREVLVPALPEDAEQLQTWLGEIRGSKVSLRVPQRGDKRALAATVLTNAEGALALHKTRRAGDLTARSKALQDLETELELGSSPLRIECFDISTLQGTHQVGSMVVFEDGLPRKSAYRQFVVRGADGEGARDDTEAMHEVITRRFKRMAAERAGQEEVDDDGVPIIRGIDPTTGRPQRFAYAPQLIVVDGGPPQVAAARRAMDELNITDVALVGLAKRLEEVWLPGEDFPLVLPRTSEGLYLLQRVRDEAHRFAITHHRKRRGRAMTRSVLDDVPGLGPSRQAALLARFGSVKAVRAAGPDVIAEVPGIGPKLAVVIHEALVKPGILEA
ncbi:excinuclease ABC subunit UvrC [Serinibacter arcticus]|uniref:UvrABC system protein C n=1 Tax=Serinibacter arcticus TaxID=1655435 RepID=A0A4Z1DZT3_9MICO|nr:excinuclease ABC subunit UvrC [Serinibacter arcticus]TGO04570.1 Excinuclease ABC subunit C [Serinibacter arcticus]